MKGSKIVRLIKTERWRSNSVSMFQILDGLVLLQSISTFTALLKHQAVINMLFFVFDQKDLESFAHYMFL